MAYGGYGSDALDRFQQQQQYSAYSYPAATPKGPAEYGQREFLARARPPLAFAFTQRPLADAPSMRLLHARSWLFRWAQVGAAPWRIQLHFLRGLQHGLGRRRRLGLLGRLRQQQVELLHPLCLRGECELGGAKGGEGWQQTP